MKKLTLMTLALCLAVPSFAGDVVGHGVESAGKATRKAATATAKDTAKATVAAVKFLF
jgi:hypothetical protein